MSEDYVLLFFTAHSVVSVYQGADVQAYNADSVSLITHKHTRA